MYISRRRLALLLILCFVLALIGWASRKYIWLYATRRADPRSPLANLLSDPLAAKNPEILLAEANRLAWVFNWLKAEPLYVRAEELFVERGNTRNEVYARAGRIRADVEIRRLPIDDLGVEKDSAHVHAVSSRRCPMLSQDR